MKQVIAAIYPRMLATSLTLPMDVLRGASQSASTRHKGKAQLSFKLAGTSLDTIATTGGLPLGPNLTVNEIEGCDMLLLPAMWRSPIPVIRQQQAWLPVLRMLKERGAIICCVGTASCFLAEAGLLDGRAATTHWNYFDRFAQLYPNVHLKRRHLITQADNLYCAGSVNSIADLMIHVVEGWFGHSVARSLENQFSPEIRRPFRAHAFQSNEDSLHHDELVLDAQQWLQDNLERTIHISELAQNMDCSKSTLARRFRQAVGSTPLQYLQQQRTANAKEMLRATNLSVGEIAWRVGLHDVSYFTKLFRKHSGLTPARYRKSVRGKLFTGSS